MIRWQATISLVGPFVIVEPEPLRGIVLHFPDGVKLVLAEPTVPYSYDCNVQHTHSVAGYLAG